MVKGVEGRSFRAPKAPKERVPLIIAAWHICSHPKGITHCHDPRFCRTGEELKAG